jgi:DNA mismatch endonuclease, patch repair protein
MVESGGSWASSPGVRASMRSNRGRDTKPELALRRAVHRLGLRYRVNTRPLPEVRRTADLVFTRARVAVFLDGCFWHGCPEHLHIPKANADWWVAKLAMNQARDASATAQLRALGWTVLRFWEHESPDVVVSTILEHLQERASSRPSIDPLRD